MMKITVAALGPDRAEQMTLEAAHALMDAGRIVLRTARHGAARWLEEKGIAYESLDALYDGAEDFDALNERAADAVMEAAAGGLCYGVPEPSSDATVWALARRNARLRIIGGVGQENDILVGAMEAGMMARGGHSTSAAIDFPWVPIRPSMPLIVTELNSPLLAGEVKIRLLDVYAPDTEVLFGKERISLDALDRQAKYDHLSCVYIPASPMTERARYTFDDLLRVMERLRRPGDGCPWDLEQTHESLRQYIIEEAYEAVDAIDRGDTEKIADELGDVLLQVVFHAQVGKDHGTFDITDVTTSICHKMITRHAHIFGDIVCETSADVLKSWEAIKKKEKGLQDTTGAMRDVPDRLPALMRAGKVQSKAGQVGFDWDDAVQALEKVREETAEVRAELDADGAVEEELGDLLFSVVNVARLAGVQPELALAAATEKFIKRFARMERAVLAEGKQLKGMLPAEMDVFWNAAKREEGAGA